MSIVSTWERTNGKVLFRLPALAWADARHLLEYSPDGKYVVSGSTDCTARVWEAATGQEVARLTHDDRVTSVAFSPDAKQLAVASNDGFVRVYVLPLEDILAIAKSRVTRALTTDECRKYLHVEQCPSQP